MKNWKRIACALLAAVLMVALFAACGGGSEPKAVNTKTGTYDEMVAYLKAKGYIANDATPVDMNTTAGYTQDNTGGEMPYSTIADKAEDWGGLWLVWFDPNAEDQENYNSMASNGGTIVIMGGANIFQPAANSGRFAIAFAEDYAQKDAVLADFNALPKE